MPSLKYSMLGSSLPFTNGSTANESIVSRPPMRDRYSQPAPASTASKATPATPSTVLLRHHG